MSERTTLYVPEACDGGADPTMNHENHRWPCGDATALARTAQGPTEVAAHKEAVQRAHSLWPGTDAEAWSARLAYTPVFVAGVSWHADQMPTARNVAEVLCEPSRHLDWPRTDGLTVCGRCLDQAQQIVALWAGDARG